MFVGSVQVGTIRDWAPHRGSVVCWHPSPATLEKARQAPVSPVPPSYQQARHIRGFSEQAALGRDYSRLLTAAYDIPGRCDIRAMTHVLNTHLRRHDTHHSWFEYRDADGIIRHTVPDPTDLILVAAEHGELTAAELHDHVLATGDPLDWECFRVGIIQREDHFTIYLAIDHVRVDPQYIAMALLEIQAMYDALASGAAPLQLPPAGSYEDFCLRQRQYTSSLTADSPEVRAWVDFAEKNGGTFPKFPLPLGDESASPAGETFTATLLDTDQTPRFEDACLEAQARFIGGVIACVALAERELVGAETYYGITPIDTRRTQGDHTAMGWFTGWIPLTVPVGSAEFPDVARAAQISFDSGPDLAQLPFDRVVELAPHLRRPQPNWPMLNFLDGTVAPFPAVMAAMQGRNACNFGDGRLPFQLSVYVQRLAVTTVTVSFPANAIARESVNRYVDTMKSVFTDVADGRLGLPRERTGPVHRAV